MLIVSPESLTKRLAVPEPGGIGKGLGGSWDRDGDGQGRGQRRPREGNAGTRRMAPRLVPPALPRQCSGDERAGGAAAVSATPATGFSARFVGSFCHPRR